LRHNPELNQALIGKNRILPDKSSNWEGLGTRGGRSGQKEKAKKELGERGAGKAWR